MTSPLSKISEALGLRSATSSPETTTIGPRALAAPRTVARGRMRRVAPLAALLALASTTQPGCFKRLEIDVPEDTGSDRELDLGDQPDSDGDGCTDAYEEAMGTDPNDPTDCPSEGETGEPGDDTGEPADDTDGDGVSDDEDAFPNDPTEWEDADKDGMGDNWERENGLSTSYDDSAEDPDNDGIPNGLEFELGTDPNAIDSTVLNDTDEDGDFGIPYGSSGEDIALDQPIVDATSINPDYPEGTSAVNINDGDDVTAFYPGYTDLFAKIGLGAPDPIESIRLNWGIHGGHEDFITAWTITAETADGLTVVLATESTPYSTQSLVALNPDLQNLNFTTIRVDVEGGGDWNAIHTLEVWAPTDL